MAGGPMAVAEAPQEPEAPEQPATPEESEHAEAPAEPEVEADAEAETAQHAKPKPSEPRARPQKLVPAEHVALLRKSNRDDYFRVDRGRLAGLSMGMVLQVVAAPVKDGKARLLGEAKVLDVRPGRSTLSADARVRNAGRMELYVVLPKATHVTAGSDESEPQASTAAPPAEAAPAQPRQLNGRAVPKRIGPFVQKIALTNSDSFAWSGCILVIQGRDVYNLGGMASGSTVEIPRSGFEKGGREVPFVGKDRVRLICTEGQNEFFVKL